MSCDLRQFQDYQVVALIILTNDDMKAVNTQENPDRVIPTTGNASHMEKGHFSTVFGKHSWNVVRLKK